MGQFSMKIMPLPGSLLGGNQQAGIGIFLRKPWAAALAAALALAILAVFAFFGLHVLRGGAFEARTVGAMVLRAAVWIGIAIYLRQGKGQRSLRS